MKDIDSVDITIKTTEPQKVSTFLKGVLDRMKSQKQIVTYQIDIHNIHLDEESSVEFLKAIKSNDDESAIEILNRARSKKGK